MFNRNNMELFRNALASLNTENFDLESFYSKQCVINAETLKHELCHDCGTTACAVGWLPILFPDIFEIVIDYFHPKINLIGQNLGSWDSSKKWLEIDETLWDYLFDYDSYARDETKNPKYVVARMDELLSGNFEPFNNWMIENDE